jgi:hypothetical protein
MFLLGLLPFLLCPALSAPLDDIVEYLPGNCRIACPFSPSVTV